MKVPLSRRIFFYTLVCSFIISTSVALFFAFGYRFDWDRKIFVHSGSITVKSNPFKVTVKINGKESKTSNILNDRYEISGLFPKTYDVEISAEGFKSWYKKVSIHSGKSTELWNVLLVKENYERANFNTPKIDNFFPAPREFIFAYTSQQDKNLEVGILDTEKNEITNKINLENISFTDNKFENIEWSPDNKALIVPVVRELEFKSNDDLDSKKIENSQKSEQNIDNSSDLNTSTEIKSKLKDYLIFSLEDNSYFYLSDKIDFATKNNSIENSMKESDAENLVSAKNNSTCLTDDCLENKNLSENKNSLNSLEISSVRWSPKEKNSVYFLINDKLYSVNFDLEEKTVLENLEIYPETLAYDFADDGIYILNKKGSVLYNRYFEVKNLKELNKFELNKSNFLSVYRLDAYDSNRIVLLENKSGRGFLFNKFEGRITNFNLGDRIVNANFSNDGKKLVYYTPSEIYVYFIRNWESQPSREMGFNQSITRLTKWAGNVFFTEDYEHIVFSTGNEIKVIDMDDRGQTDLKTITSLNTDNTKVISDPRNNFLYFLDNTENGENNLFRISFPEKSSFLNNILE